MIGRFRYGFIFRVFVLTVLPTVTVRGIVWIILSLPGYKRTAHDFLPLDIFVSIFLFHFYVSVNVGSIYSRHNVRTELKTNFLFRLKTSEKLRELIDTYCINDSK